MCNSEDGLFNGLNDRDFDECLNQEIRKRAVQCV